MCLGVGWDLWLELDVTLIFLDIARQHLQYGCLHGTEHPLKYGVILMLIVWVDCGGSSTFASLALTRVLPKSFVFLRLRQGLEIHCSSSVVGLIILPSSLTFRSGV